MKEAVIYYAKDGVVWKNSVKNTNPDGSANYTLGFPVCTMPPAVGDDAAEEVARLMNAGEAAHIAEMDDAFRELEGS